jgi:hypothetical protein
MKWRQFGKSDMLYKAETLNQNPNAIYEENSNTNDLCITVRLDLVVLEMLLALLVHFSICAETQHEECNHDQNATNNRCHRKRIACSEPVHQSYKEDSEESSD